ncbi:hypothetical protein [Streptomyces hirsutus]|uniref:hypothetical protein n=1 Tax=Streptomyces hirsutus TaxID=35620 RepID=UPI0012FEF94D|nr:hypothetical protein [Streptomyces hirsutus]
MILLLVPSLKKLLDSVAYRNRARGKAEIIRAERSVGGPQQVSSNGRRQTKQGKGKASG